MESRSGDSIIRHAEPCRPRRSRAPLPRPSPGSRPSCGPTGAGGSRKNWPVPGDERQAKLLQGLPHLGRHGRGPVDGARLVLDPLEALVPAAGSVLPAAAAGTGGVAGAFLVGHGLVLLRRPIIAGRGSRDLHQDHPDQDGGGDDLGEGGEVHAGKGTEPRTGSAAARPSERAGTPKRLTGWVVCKPGRRRSPTLRSGVQMVNGLSPG
jgi:hypothetical protein